MSRKVELFFLQILPFTRLPNGLRRCENAKKLIHCIIFTQTQNYDEIKYGNSLFHLFDQVSSNNFSLIFILINNIADSLNKSLYLPLDGNCFSHLDVY